MSSSRQIERTAAAWLAQRDGGRWSERDQARLEAWLSASTAHRVAFLRLESAWQQSDRLKALGAGLPAGTLPERGQWAPSPFLGSREPASETTRAASALSASRTPRRSGRMGRYFGAAAALVLAVSSVGLWHHLTAVEQTSYQSGLGELRLIPLADGSRATLSSDSRILVSMSRSERRIDLQQGEAFFDVAKDPGRPFVVAAGARRAVAVGTHYAVRRDAANLRVVVTEGTVRLETDSAPDQHPQPTTLLPAGSVALASRNGVLVRSGSVEEAEQQLNWRSGFLAFHDTPLADAAAEFNRYNARKIVIGDAETAAMRVGGNFRWSNVDVFVRLLEQGFPVRAEYRDDRIVLRSQ
ncbi:FecR domain-containing protein [Luteimonas sp. SX5]|uniref:FecR domain-containing protein n=1 Tax=Luteimonas galliterrae TaxID=2940486 RepID=A0ABT0MIF0_9GAMM|nr:FecR domain-containing protein [Luteimonas galliterrae]MCL1634393.1 FecR domain-containing protein [Luteimonas galliterrae]